nr:uncharacterized protein LOC127491082 [Oryctolagus cuniculus]XP_051701903.1 uncharacterized protein LOC127491082 [Oryctolagus cuniculus]XP_051701904.1 uncharacterized protein LOC127491082 [Oryctolagus cuniculus]XP_051701905.1 uncharacterized protein LOC127491082 [Oryctolagus cuniculus]XP_051701906.1 uncharacterized protein LOC127491082 [Oryctolagus cuniculus]XP_051701907.1 uncharacterized protein LOC127491082 [Oryctolagus cuniculus]XP_051701908.1 uncharacterized protein LOC127491082 [Orycto
MSQAPVAAHWQEWHLGKACTPMGNSRPQGQAQPTVPIISYYARVTGKHASLASLLRGQQSSPWVSPRRPPQGARLWSPRQLSRVGLRPLFPQQQLQLQTQRPWLCPEAGPAAPSVCGNGSGRPAWPPGLCFERRASVGGGAAPIQSWPRGLPRWLPRPAHDLWVRARHPVTTKGTCESAPWFSPLPLAVALLTLAQGTGAPPSLTCVVPRLGGGLAKGSWRGGSSRPLSGLWWPPGCLAGLRASSELADRSRRWWPCWDSWEFSFSSVLGCCCAQKSWLDSKHAKCKPRLATCGRLSPSHSRGVQVMHSCAPQPGWSVPALPRCRGSRPCSTWLGGAACGAGAVGRRLGFHSCFAGSYWMTQG